MIEWIIGGLVVAHSLFNATKTSSRPKPSTNNTPRVESDESRRNAKNAEWRIAWEKEVDRLRWIPQSAAHRIMEAYPPPGIEHQSTYNASIIRSAKQRELLTEFEKLNEALVVAQKVRLKDFFGSVEKDQLTEEQIKACICMDDAVMIVAAAGSGKTSTMVAKTGYVLHETLATPDQILLLAFNTATAKEVSERIIEQLSGVPNVDRVRSNTFHSFGMYVIGKATGKRPSLAPWVDTSDAGADVREISNIIETLSAHDKSFKRDWDLFRTIYARDVGRWEQDDAPEDAANGKRGFLTAKGEIVKSKEERMIADWLFYHGVNYEYERAYEYDTADEQHRQYVPDFYYPDIQLYHEHFALNDKGEAPKHFKNYLQGVKWKRKIHCDKGTALIETTSHSLKTGAAISMLASELISRRVELIFDPDRQGRGLEPVSERDLINSFRTFQQHVKNNGLTHDQLHAALNAQSKDGYAARLRMYLSIYERIAAEWEQRLRVGNFIDFEDMLIQAADHVESGRYKSPYTIILADEFQDSSRARIRLLKALANSPSAQTHLCVVGDDWQGINRFAGSDISVMTEFESTFEFATRLSLNATFRCPQSLCDVSSEFIRKNPLQIEKTVETTNKLTKTPMLAFGFKSKHSIAGYVEKQLEEMTGYAREGRLRPLSGSKISVMILGRYRADRPAALQEWQRRFEAWLSIDYKTVHGSKGLEAEYVFILNVIQGTRGFPSQLQDDPALQLAMPAPDPYPYAEERRLFYVAITRARKQVRIYTTLDEPSQFLIELTKSGHLQIQPIDGEPLKACPACGSGVLQLKRSKHGSFHGCSRYPACAFTRST